MRMWWWRKIRRAQIAPSERDLFERYGENVIQMILCGHAGVSTPPELMALYRSPDAVQRAAVWLTERADEREQHEQRLETLEWAILIFVFLGVIVDGMLAAHEFGWRL